MNEITITYDFSRILLQLYQLVYSRKIYGTGDFDELLSKKFGLEKQFTHFIIKSCIDLLEDTEYAIMDFEKFGLDGPTKYNNAGERYLRLYGFLNAVNSQKSIVQTLHEIFKVPEKKKDLNSRLKKIKIIDTRHMIASHTVDYLGDNGRNYFRVSMTTVRGKGENIQIVSKDKLINVDLVNELKEFRTVIHMELLQIVKHLLKRFTDKNSNSRKEIQPEIEFVEARMNGDMVMQGANGKIIITSRT